MSIVKSTKPKSKTPSIQKKKIVGAKKNKKGNITNVLFENNKNYTSIKKAIEIAKRHGIENINVIEAIDKKPHLRTKADKKKNNNLDDMANF